ncbi:MAG: hypothetical protein Ta2F_02680 [Termitinemataceae bacterium]|nr:MAG: hypothetical protein Ta2F_02680 [Termitinemataceae bacterium]
MKKVFPTKNYKEGDVIITEDVTIPDCFYIINAGKVRITSNSGMPLLHDKAVLTAGEFFGISSCLNSEKSTTTAIAECEATLLCVPKSDFPEFIAENLGLMNKILAYLSARLRLLNDYLTSSSTQATKEEPFDMLYTNAEYYFGKSLNTQAFCSYKKYLKFAPNGKYSEQAKEKLKKLEEFGKDIRFDYSEKELKRIYPANSLIFSEKEPGTEMFVVQRGKINITKIVDGNEIVLAVLKHGDILGEMGLIDQKPRSANAVASEECEIMAIARAIYLPLLKDGNVIIERICNTLAQRICSMHIKIKTEK